MFRGLMSVIVLVTSLAAVDPRTADADQPTATTAAALTIADVTALLDHDQAADIRQAALDKATALAKAKNADALFLLGTLYAWGKEHPSALVDKDNAKAELYLSNAVAAGDFAAIPRLVDVELALHKPDAAIIWATVHLYYWGSYEQGTDHKETHRELAQTHAAIAAELVQRCIKALGPAYDEKAVQEDAEAVISQFGLRASMEDAAVNLPFSDLNSDGHIPEWKHTGYLHGSTDAAHPESGIWEQQSILVIREDGTVDSQYFFDATPGAKRDVKRSDVRAASFADAEGAGIRIAYIDWLNDYRYR